MSVDAASHPTGGFAVRKRILVVEDDAMQRNVLALFLNGQNFYVETAVDGLDAIQRARLGWFDVILMDCRLPEVDGVAASRLIADLTRDHGSPKIIALTGWPELARQPADAGGHVFFAIEPKPWDPDTLLRHIQAAPGPAGAQEHEHPGARRPADTLWPPVRDGETDTRQDSHERPCVLLVDDDDMPRTLVAAALMARGCRVDEAHDGLQAVLMMGETTYDAAIIDYALPKLNGAAAARLVHDLLARADRPKLIALTASPDALRDKINGLASAFSEIVAKDSGIPAVLAAVERCLLARRSPGLNGQQQELLF
jgi:two-component system sensor histidine kinase/response regulator